MGLMNWSGRLVCVTVAMAAVGCSHVVQGAAARQTLPGEAACAKVSAPRATIDAKDDSEPVMRIPTPANWQRTTMLDSQLIRYAMADRALAANGFAPTVVVTLEDVSGNSGSAKDIIAAEWSAVSALAGGTDPVTTSDGTVCGSTAQTVTYTLPPMGAIPSRSATALAVVTSGPKKYAAVVTLQTTEPDNPTYAADSKTILDGFQVLSEKSGNS